MLFSASQAQVDVQTHSIEEAKQSVTTNNSQSADDQNRSEEEDDARSLSILTVGTDLPPGTPSFLLSNLVLGQSFHSTRLANDTSTDILGSLQLLKFWHRSVTSLDYVGGASFYPSDSVQATEQIQRFTAAQGFLWRRRHLTIVDSFGNSSSGGTFGSSLFGGEGLFDLIFAGTSSDASSSLGLPLFTGSATLGAWTGSQIVNVSLAELTNELTKRSYITALGSYGASLYSNSKLVNSHQLSLALQYGYRMSARSTVGVLYAYRNFRYPLSSEGSVDSNIAQIVYRYRISPRLGVVIGAGPELDSSTSEITIPIVTPPLVLTSRTEQLNASAFGSLAYAFKKSSLQVSYQRLTTAGSGIFVGANTDAAQVTTGRQLLRVWTASFSSGYGSLRQIQKQLQSAAGRSYQYWYISAGASRSLGPRLSFVVSYQFNRDYASYGCDGRSGCIGPQHTILFGLSWRARPIRLGTGNGETAQPVDLDTGDPSPHLYD